MTKPPRTLPQNGHNVGTIIDALKLMQIQHERNLVTDVYPTGSRAHAQVVEATQHARQVLAGTRKYGAQYTQEGEHGRTQSATRRNSD